MFAACGRGEYVGAVDIEKAISLNRFLLSRIALPLSLVVALPTLAQAEQWGFPSSQRKAPRPQQTQQTMNAPVHTAPNTTYIQSAEAGVDTPTIGGTPTVIVDKNSGRYLQSVGRRVADRPLACPPRSKRK
jgi:hypothetical protein